MSAITSIQTLPPQPSRLTVIGSLIMDRKVATAALFVLFLLVLMAALAPWVTPYLPNNISVLNRLKPPSAEFWFGTDEFGRDVFTRTVYAARVSLSVGLAVVMVSMVAGVVLGIIA